MHEPGVARPDRNGLRVAEPNEFDAGNVDGPDGGIEAMNAVESRSRTSEGRPQTGSQLVAIHGRTWPPGQPGRLRGKSKTETRRADPHRGPTRPKVPDSDGVIYANRPGAAAADPTSPTPPGSRLAAAGLLRPADQCARHRAPSHQPRLRVRDDRHGHAPAEAGAPRAVRPVTVSKERTDRAIGDSSALDESLSCP
jgi:hypothetical protein